MTFQTWQKKWDGGSNNNLSNPWVQPIPTQPNPCGLGWTYVIGWVGLNFFLTHHSGFSQKILSTRPNLTMHTPTQNSTPSKTFFCSSCLLFSNLQNLLLLASFLCLIIDIHFSFLISVNSNEAVSSTNRLKAFISIAYYGPLKRWGSWFYSSIPLFFIFFKMIWSIFV